MNSYAKSAYRVLRAQKLIRRPVVALIQYAFLAHCAYAADSVTIQLSGEISPRCEINNLAAVVDLGTLNSGGEQILQFDVHCNDSFSYQLTSRHGGLRHSDTAADNPAFLSLLPYSIDIAIPTDNGAITEQCESAQIRAGSQGCGVKASEGSAATNKTGSLVIRWDSTTTPIAGTYRDVLSLTLQPVL